MAEKKKRKIDFVYFDLGHVIVPLNQRSRVIQFCAAFSDFDANTIEQTFDWKQSSDYKKFWETVCAFDRGKIYPFRFYERIKQILKLDLDFKAFVMIWQMMLDIDPRFIELLRQLRAQKIRTGIISDLCIIHYNRVLKLLPRDLFDICFFSFMEGHLKKDKRGLVFRRAIRAANLPPEKILFIDDREINNKVAEKCGLRIFHYKDNFDEFVKHLKLLGIRV